MLRTAVGASRALQRRVICVRSVNGAHIRWNSRLHLCRKLATTSSPQTAKAEVQPESSSSSSFTQKLELVPSRSVPFSQRSLIRLLITEKVLDQKDQTAFEQFCSALEFSVRKHHQRLADEIYPLFGQLRTDEKSNRSATADDEFWFLNRLAQLATKAGFCEADEAQLRSLIEQSRRVNTLIVSSNATRYDVLRCFVLDVADREQVERAKADAGRSAPKKRGLFGRLFGRLTKRSKSQAETAAPSGDVAKPADAVKTNTNIVLSAGRKCKRVLLVYRVKSSTFSSLRVLMLKDVALNELERALPDTARLVQIAPLYRRVVRAASLLCSGAVISQLAALYSMQSAYVTATISNAALNHAAIWCTQIAVTSGALAIGTIALATRQQAAYERSALDIAQHHVVATSKSLIQLLFERASAETLKEATLAYAFLLKSGATLSESEFYEVRQLGAGAGKSTAPSTEANSPSGLVFGRSGMSQFLLETMIQKWFSEKFHLTIKYNADDAVTFLASAGLLVDAEDPNEYRSAAASPIEPSGLVSAAVRVGTRGKHLRVLAPLDCAMRALPYNVHFYALGIDPLSQTRLIKTDAKLAD